MSIRRRSIAVFACLALTLVGTSRVASADKEASVAIYKKGKKKYNLGEFAKAIELFKEAYEIYEAPAYLYNIAQAYRQLNDCKNALFFYERFLAEKPGSSAEATIKEYVADLKKECGDSASEAEVFDEIDDPAKKEPASPPPTPPKPESESSGGSAADLGASKTEEPRGPLAVLSADLGFAIFSMGEVNLPVSPTVRLGAAYPVEMGKYRLEAGAGILLSNMAYQEDMGDSGVNFTSYFLNVAASAEIAPKIRGGAELGLGLFSVGALEAGNPFIEAGLASESQSTFQLRIGLQAEYLLNDSLGLSFAPAFQWASAHDELASDIGSVTSFQFLGGVRYRL